MRSKLVEEDVEEKKHKHTSTNPSSPSSHLSSSQTAD